MSEHSSSPHRRFELRQRLCAADIAGVKAIREVCPEARMVPIDPLVNVVAPRDRPDLVGDITYTGTVAVRLNYTGIHGQIARNS